LKNAEPAVREISAIFSAGLPLPGALPQIWAVDCAPSVISPAKNIVTPLTSSPTSLKSLDVRSQSVPDGVVLSKGTSAAVTSAVLKGTYPVLMVCRIGILIYSKKKDPDTY